jgi:hypothetical protein
VYCCGKNSKDKSSIVGTNMKINENFFTFAAGSGVLAQLARALDWQSKGQGFDSPILHKECPWRINIQYIMDIFLSSDHPHTVFSNAGIMQPYLPQKPSKPGQLGSLCSAL